ncbi:hypothetical protein LYSHEL_27030 [Lysobacter helvus]|uniref:Immunity protein 7 of polymorphic toxin system n=2 Tax=Lysobacteraceae TaxID=32033 RepID=A0ABM7Q8C0_9GAMM|nr:MULTISPECIES: hypothetical protein [Lysobacter]BCT93676.1 hypothetical protein LYSCAS_27000 [Lysobacter caseinilyticus]BCT96832.1 hypothetical protein LYSHEL_27030 [Lysobacter helvus]
MRAEIEDWKNGWFGIGLGLSVHDIERLIALLTELRDDPDQHFHLSSDYAGAGGVGDIEIYVQSSDEPSNMHLFGMALAPGEFVQE